MPFALTITHGLPYLQVELSGPAGIAECLGAADLMGTVAGRLEYECVLINMLGVELNLSFTDHLMVGSYVAERLSAMRAVATVITPAYRVGTSEKAAQKSGLTLRAFVDLEEARAWIQGHCGGG